MNVIHSSDALKAPSAALTAVNDTTLHSGFSPPSERQFSKILLSIIQLKIIIHYYFYLL
jgi:hypothetical protein